MVSRVGLPWWKSSNGSAQCVVFGVQWQCDSFTTLVMQSNISQQCLLAQSQTRLDASEVRFRIGSSHPSGATSSLARCASGLGGFAQHSHAAISVA